MRRSYRRADPRWWQQLSDLQVAVLAGSVVLGTWLQRPAAAIALGAICGWRRAWRAVGLAVVVAGVVAGVLSARAWRGTEPDTIGPYRGWACLVTDPAPGHGAVNA
ncbi:MAG TPA: hypothetical protein PLV68_20045, partial [Ilumatobacteraceae bacterium]|nr:hypothetical protein [Ilumatobacteraceae bacterium]